MSTQYLINSAVFIFLGYLIGVFFKGLNPFKMFLGILMASIAIPGLINTADTLHYISFVIGITYAYGNPIKWLFSCFEEVSLSLQLAKARSLAKEQDYIYQTREDLNRQSEELQRQKAEAESEILRQQQKAQEQLRQEREQLQKERDKFYQEMQKKKGPQFESLNPKHLTDAYKILGVKRGASLEDSKKAYRHLCALFHPDKFARIDGILKQQAEESLKLVNAAWDTIEKALK